MCSLLPDILATSPPSRFGYGYHSNSSCSPFDVGAASVAKKKTRVGFGWKAYVYLNVATSEWCWGSSRSASLSPVPSPSPHLLRLCPTQLCFMCLSSRDGTDGFTFHSEIQKNVLRILIVKVKGIFQVSTAPITQPPLHDRGNKKNKKHFIQLFILHIIILHPQRHDLTGCNSDRIKKSGDKEYLWFYIID